MPSVSFVIPVYGVERYLEKCLDSVLSQTFEDWECILVDDGSPDRSGEICDRYARSDGRFRVIHKENGGVSAARNDGFALARGEWTLFVDSDDWLEPDAAEVLREVGEREGVDCVFSYGDAVEEGREPVPLTPYDESFLARGRCEVDRIQIRVLYQTRIKDYTCYVAPWSKFVRTSVLRANGISFDPYLRGMFDDGLFSLNLFESCDSVYYFNKKTYNYRLVGGSMTRSFKPNSIETQKRGHERIRDFLTEHKKGPDFWDAYYAHVVVWLGASLSSYYFNPNNPSAKRESTAELTYDLVRDPYWTASHKVKLARLKPKDRYLALCERLRFMSGLKLYVFAKNMVQQHKNR